MPGKVLSPMKIHSVLTTNEIHFPVLNFPPHIMRPYEFKDCSQESLKTIKGFPNGSGEREGEKEEGQSKRPQQSIDSFAPGQASTPAAAEEIKVRLRKRS